MAEILVIRSYNLLPIKKIKGVVPGNPSYLDVQGDDFTKATKAYINDKEVGSFLILTNNRILVEIPDSTTEVKKVEIRSEDLVGSNRRRMEFSLSDPRIATGVDRCIQRFLTVLLRSPGSDIFRPMSGGGVLSLVGKPIESKRMGAISAAVQSAIQRTEAYLLRGQVGVVGVPADELLGSAELITLSVDDDSGLIMPHIRLITVASKAVTFTVG